MDNQDKTKRKPFEKDMPCADATGQTANQETGIMPPQWTGPGETAALETYLENAPDGIYMTDMQGNFLYGNRKSEEIIGYDRRDLLCKNLLQSGILTGKSLKKAAESLALSNNGKPTGPDEFELVRKDGHLIPVEIKTSVIEYKGQRSILGFVRDITRRKNIEEELLQSHAMYRTIFDNSGTPMSIIGEDMTILLCNEELAKSTGYSREEIEGKMKWTSFVHAEDLAVMQTYHTEREAGSVGIPRQYEFRLVDKHGNVRNVINTVAMIPGTKTRVAAQLDITNVRQAEKEKEKLQSQLLQSQKMEAIGTLAGGIAHDFNNILTALIGYASLLKMNLGKDNPLGSYADQILSSSEKAAQLTRSLLTFSRKQPITLKPVKLNDIINNTEKLLKRLLTEDIALKTCLTDNDTAIMGDPTQIDQILLNLATNARDAMPRGGNLTIETKRIMIDEEFIRVHGYGEKGIYVLISISDTGVGFDEKTREHIFDPFFTTKEVGKGTGLGLATVYGIVKQHNGYINTYSEPERGTTFHIFFPAITMAAEKEHEVVPDEIRGGNEIILVAEDHEEVRNLIRTVLSRYGYTIIESVDGEDAIVKYNNSARIDLLIIDSVMPKMNGREVYDRIRAIKPDIKALFMSGYTRDIILDKGIEEKDFHFIAKPLSPHELLLKIRQILDNGPDSHNTK